MAAIPELPRRTPEEIHTRYRAIHDSLEKLKKDNKEKYDQLLEKFRSQLPTLGKTASLEKISSIIAKEGSDGMFQEIQKATQVYQAKIVKERLKPSKSEFITALDLFVTADKVVSKLEMRIFNNAKHKITVKSMAEDAKKIATIFTPRTLVQRTPSGIIEQKATEADLKKVDAIIVNGNNDLEQVDHAAVLYQKVINEKVLSHNGNLECKVYVSGFGGHATSPGAIFAQTEAETMRQRLIDKGVPSEDIVLETEATNSGENVRFVVEKMKQNGSPQNLMICGTPAAILRQMRSFEKQASYEWQSLISFPPKDLSRYYETEREALINLMCSLREVASFVDYTVNTEYMSPREVQNTDGLSEAVSLLTKYYNILNPSKKMTNAEIETLISKFVEFSLLKAQGVKAEDLKPLKDEIQKLQKPIADFFRNAFNQIELAWVKVLSSRLPAQQHREYINNFADYLTKALDLSYPI